MKYGDWYHVLEEIAWRLGLTLGVAKHYPGHILFFPLYMSKRLKGYFARVHIHFGVSSYLSRSSSQPEPCMSFLLPLSHSIHFLSDGMRQLPSTPMYFKRSPELSTWCEVDDNLCLEFSDKITLGSVATSSSSTVSRRTRMKGKAQNILPPIDLTKAHPEIETPPDVAVGERFLTGTKELPAMPIIERVCYFLAFVICLPIYLGR
jgi:hypothetical protein